MILTQKCSVTVMKLIHEDKQLGKLFASLSSLSHSTQLLPWCLLQLVHTRLTPTYWFQIPIFIHAFGFLWLWQFLNFPFYFFSSKDFPI